MSSQEINEILNAINVLYDEHSKKKNFFLSYKMNSTRGMNLGYFIINSSLVTKLF